MGAPSQRHDALYHWARRRTIPRVRLVGMEAAFDVILLTADIHDASSFLFLFFLFRLADVVDSGVGSDDNILAHDIVAHVSTV